MTPALAYVCWPAFHGAAMACAGPYNDARAIEELRGETAFYIGNKDIPPDAPAPTIVRPGDALYGAALASMGRTNQ